MSVTGFKYCFTPRMTFLALTAMSLFIWLGFWQIHRGLEKKHWMAKHVAASKLPPSPFVGKMPAQYRRLSVQGQFMQQIFLLDNQHHDHHFGYDVISPLVLASGQVVLVDRGFVEGDVSRQTLPQVHTPKQVISLVGQAYYPSNNTWWNASLWEKKEKPVAVIEHIDFKKLSLFLQKSAYPFIIRQTDPVENDFVRDWAIVSMPPERHYAYALQWFVFALVVLIIYVSLNVKK